MKPLPTAEEFFEQHIQRGVNNTHSNYLNTAIEFAKLHVEAALHTAHKKSMKKLSLKNYEDELYKSEILTRVIIDSYPPQK